MFEPERINKIQAAERQLKEAITLFFEGRDPIAIHTLTLAAHEILYQLGKPQDVQSLLFNPDQVCEEFWREWNQASRQYSNFFKHSGKDPDATIEFKPELNVYAILDCISIYNQITKSHFAETKVFFAWVGLRYPRLIKEGTYKDLLLKHCGSLNPTDLGVFLNAIPLFRKFDSN